MEKKYCYKYPRPALTSDCVIFGFDKKTGIILLLIERKYEPFKGYWAFPGGFVEQDETTYEAANRELFEETNLRNIKLKQLQTFSDINRDPRGRVISVVYYAIINIDELKTNPKAGDDAKNIKWFQVSKIPKLAFDHKKILKIALKNI